jgi:hypothetical protein
MNPWSTSSATRLETVALFRPVIRESSTREIGRLE